LASKARHRRLSSAIAEIEATERHVTTLPRALLEAQALLRRRRAH
jgi:hypothetical protein